ncbi:guanylate kinase [Hamiltosporidium magnivora]|uniref:Guanylate kinase n=1 Tax=Hamiltosporidium magnivora TaxID=148818 RepID=A0A4Q9LFJ7_9MICR|nr:guanylate kinase [Hamiltosporidium magnivora]
MYVVISGPSGSGKSSVIKLLMANNRNIKFSISYTTRQKRCEEKENIDYHFVSKETFLEMVKQKRFVEYTLYNDNYYGTPFCEEHENEIIIFDLDRNGVKSLMNSGVKCLFIYIHCDVEDLKERLYKRLGNSISQENLNDIEKRISRIEKDLEVFRKEDYDLVVENSDLYQTYKTVEEFILNK